MIYVVSSTLTFHSTKNKGYYYLAEASSKMNKALREKNELTGSYQNPLGTT